MTPEAEDPLDTEPPLVSQGVPTRTQLRTHLVSSRIAGDVATPREGNLANYLRMSRREPLYVFGLRLEGSWTPAEVLGLMAERCGVSPDAAHTHGQDRIDPDRTLGRLDAMADRLGRAADVGERVLFATGHPGGLRAVHTALARALRAAGCRLLDPVPDWSHPLDPAYGDAAGKIRFLDGVGVLADPGGTPRHTHSPLPMEAVLAELERRGEGLPDLVVADHGWAGAAGEHGVDSVGFADCNDPALFAGEAEGKVLVCVPLDDGLAPALYEPLIAYLLDRSGTAPRT